MVRKISEPQFFRVLRFLPHSSNVSLANCASGSDILRDLAVLSDRDSLRTCLKLYGNGLRLPIQIARKKNAPRRPHHPLPGEFCRKHVFVHHDGVLTRMARSFLPSLLSGTRHLSVLFKKPKILLTPDPSIRQYPFLVSPILRVTVLINKLQYLMG